jgi:arylsulfatase A-like enzyme
MNRVHFAIAFVMTSLIGSNFALAGQPNIVVILTDDQGYADISLNPQHAKEVSTPHMDALAKDGVVFSQGYTSGHVCSPTRAGIMVGGYSQSVGVYTAGDGGRGFDPKKKIFPGYLPDEYVSTAIGKWHLGLDDDYPELKWHAMSRGFDECYKFMGRGGHSYFDLRSDTDGKFSGAIYRNKERINDEGYLTSRLTEEAVEFIDRNKKDPFFLYLAYNAVHAPAEAPEEDIKAYREKFPGLSKERAILMAMLKHLDDGVGDVVGKLKREGLFDNTILFFLTDNGGSKAMSADNTPLRGFKQMLDEGGIRTPFIVSWPDKFKGGRTVDTPVISFDILPTALDALGEMPAHNDFAGKSFLPLLTGESKQHHDTLFWSKGPDDEWAVRRGDWKLHWTKGRMELVNLADDLSETKNLADSNADKVKELSRAYDKWIATMVDPITGGDRRKDESKKTTASSEQKEMTPREIERERIREQRRAAKQAAKEKAAAKAQSCE